MGVVYVGIDASLTSTAICIDGKYSNITSNKTTGKWYSAVSDCVKFSAVHYPKSNDYSDGEIQKIRAYSVAASAVLDSLFSQVSDDDFLNVYMEGYSYSSAAGPLIDLVTFGAYVRLGLLKKLGNRGTLTIIAPMSLKTFACSHTYGDKYVQSKSKKVLRNDEGIPGGSFKKREMLKAAYDAGGCEIVDRIDDLKSVLIMSNIPKPIDDLVDSWWLKTYAKTVNLTQNAKG